ncbi:phage tail tape measure C-terminal domain-containing protein [Litorimonas haliclonae]|uniref:phage tail tape measure C-terminal domain-containing protein n=1 Tax=Litorimonas haliclonae TaxID=2081977 RepID=UPI0039EE5E0C
MTDANRAAEAVSNFDIEGAADAANDMAQAFEKAGDRISNALERAARNGEFSLSNMAESITRDLARLAVRELISDPLQTVFSNAIQSVAEQSYSSKSTPVNVTMNVSGVSSPSEFKKSETQLAAGLSRALNQGRKLL